MDTSPQNSNKLGMMKKIIIVLLSFLVCCGCSNQTESKTKIDDVKQTAFLADTIIGKKTITNEIAGSAYRKRATGYFVIVKNDTSDFMPIFAQSKDDNSIGIHLNLPYTKHTRTFVQRLSELKLILPLASNEFNFDAIKTISVGRLILTGDLAVDITTQYKNKFGDAERITTADYQRISDFLLESKLTSDLNELFKPYSISVETINIEKVFFTTKSELSNYSKLDKDTTEIPERILDCVTWIKLKKE
jgi:hypothetical protein